MRFFADINNITHVNTSNFALKTNYNTKITELENKILNTSNLVKKMITILKLLN